MKNRRMALRYLVLFRNLDLKKFQLVYKKKQKMDIEKIKEIPTEELQKKEKSTKRLITVFIPTILGLGYFVVRNYMKGESFDTTSAILILCAIGGMISLFPELKAIQKELKER